MVFAARLTQRGHKINTMEGLTALYEKSFSIDTVTAISKLPAPHGPEIRGYHRCHLWAQAGVSGADHQAPERSKVYERVLTVQQLCGAGGLCRAL